MAEWKKVVVSGSAISQLQNDSNYLVSGDSSVELTGSFKGDGSQLTGVTSDQTGEALTDGSGISDFTFDGSTAVSISVQNDGSTLTVGGGGVKVSDAGITATQLAASVAGDGLAGGAGTALSVNTDGTSITTSGDSLTLAGTAFSSSVDSRIDAAQSLATTNSASIANLGSGFATDSELLAVSSSANVARGVVASNAYNTTLALSGSAHTQRVAIETSLDGKIGTEKGRIDAILSASVADTDSFAEIVSLINSVDTTNDQAFAGFVTSSNGRATAIEGSVTALSGSAHTANESLYYDILNNKYGIQDLSSKIDNNEGEISSLDTEVKINTQNIQDAEYDLAINAQGIAANTSAIANLGSGFATDSELSGLSGSAHTARGVVASDAASATSALSGSAHIARASVASDASAARLVLENSVEFTTDALQEFITQNSQVMGMNMQAINSIFQTQLPALDGKISTEKGRIDAILSASVADTDSFAEIVSLINSVDTTNDSAFAGFVTSSNSRATAIEGSVTALSGSAAAANALIISDVSANSGSIATNNTNIANNTEFIQNVQTQTGQGFASINQSIAIQIDRISGSAEAANALIISDVSANSASIAALDGNYATDSSVTALSGSAHTARGVVASDAASATSALSGSVLSVTNALDTRVDTLEGASHAHSNKANLDQINQDLGTSDNVNFNDLVVDGNLTVSGTTTTVNTANLLVEDKFILLNSGSADPDEGGIIIDEGAGSGHAFIYDKGDTRWGFNASVAQDASTANATAHAAAVVDMQNVAHNDSAEYQKVGNIKIDNGDIFIYTNTAVTTPIQSGDPFASEYKVYNGGGAGNFSYTDALGVFQSRYLSPGQDQMVCAKVDSIFSPIGMTVTLWSTFCPQMPSGGLVAL